MRTQVSGASQEKQQMYIKDLKTLIFRQDTPDFLKMISYTSYKHNSPYKSFINLKSY